MNYSTGNLPSDPQKLLQVGWLDVTPTAMKASIPSREYYNPQTGIKVRFDPKTVGAPGFEGVDHYHIYNPNRTSRRDYYLDIRGNPVSKGSKESHILPEDA
ncbi:hypothetical protein QUF64_11660 [Anaerolineales bacterium HSG6]|nr:hypothetical protein [Anaerolineales bacterium HSG6]MDM8530724.1 hypothetical protein [Anaerolineales bacterium HSG25]